MSHRHCRARTQIGGLSLACEGPLSGLTVDRRMNLKRKADRLGARQLERSVRVFLCRHVPLCARQRLLERARVWSTSPLVLCADAETNSVLARGHVRVLLEHATKRAGVGVPDAVDDLVNP
jgi:hypothetical protein